MVVVVATAATILHVAVARDLEPFGNGFSKTRTLMIVDATVFSALTVDILILIFTYSNTYYFQTAYAGNRFTKIIGGKCGIWLQRFLFLVCFVMVLLAFFVLIVSIAWYCFTFVFKQLCVNDVVQTPQILNSLPLVKHCAPGGKWTEQNVIEGCQKIKGFNNSGFWLRVIIALSCLTFAQMLLFASTAYNIGVHALRQDGGEEEGASLNKTPRSDIGLTPFGSGGAGANQGYRGDTIKYVDDEDGI